MSKKVTSQIALYPTRRGFTIVELLIVVVVIAILAAITIVAYNGITKQTKVASLNSDLKNNATALENEKTVAGSYPETTSLVSSAGNNVNYFYSRFTPNYYCVQATNGTLNYNYQSNSGAAKAGSCPGPAYITATKGNVASGGWYVTLSLQNMQAGSYRVRCAVGGNPTSSYATYNLPASGFFQLNCSVSSAAVGQSVSAELEGIGLAAPITW